jgi:hypothetical protein
VVIFFDADGLAGEGNAEIDLVVIEAKTSAAGDDNAVFFPGLLLDTVKR